MILRQEIIKGVIDEFGYNLEDYAEYIAKLREDYEDKEKEAEDLKEYIVDLQEKIEQYEQELNEINRNDI